MPENTPILLIPGLNCSARLYAAQVPVLWRFGPVTIADHTQDDTMVGIARRILANAPPRFALAGLSMGGYIAFEIMRQAPNRVDRLALLDTSARPDVPTQTQQRDELIRLASRGRFAEITETMWPFLVHPNRHKEAGLKGDVRMMADDVGPEAYVRQMIAIKGRSDSRPSFGAISVPTLVLVGDADQRTPPPVAREMAEGIAGSELVTIPDCGHLSTMEKPDAVSRALVAWMER